MAALIVASLQTPEATSLSGKPLVSVPPAGAQKARLEADLAKAQADYDRDPSSAEAAIWLGRRLAYLGRFRDAIDAYTRGIARHPAEARLYRLIADRLPDTTVVSIGHRSTLQVFHQRSAVLASEGDHFALQGKPDGA